MAETAESMYNQMNDPSGLVWVTHTGTDTVPDAVYAGKHANGQEVYVARAMVDGYPVVGKFVPDLGGDFPYDFGTPLATFQVLTNPKQVQTKWALGEGANIHPNAVKGVFTGNKIRYIGRTKYEGNSVVGCLTPTHCHLFFSHSGTSHSTAQYEILLAKPKPACQCEMHFRLPFNCSPSCLKKM